MKHLLSGRLLLKCLVAMVGGVVVLIGLILIPLPGPGLLVVLGGLLILSTEFVWAKRYVKAVKRRLPFKRFQNPGGAPDNHHEP